MSYFRDNIDSMTAYVPGAQPAAGETVIKLNTNENPYPPSPKALAALGEFDGERLCRYPHPMAGQFRAAVASVLGIGEGWILPGNGSDELIVIIARACAGSNRPIVYPYPTFEFYLTQAQIENAGPIQVSFDDEYNLPVDGLVAAGGAVTYVANPGSPSGTAVSNDALSELAERLTGVLVIDEAYVDFAESDSLELAKNCDNVILLRTLSKGYSLAGLRLGYAVANPQLLDGLAKVKDIYNVDCIADCVGAAAFEDQAYKIATAAKVNASRAKLTSDLEALGWSVLPSQANFVLVRPPGGNAQQVHQSLKDRRILVRYFNSPKLEDRLRITIGTDEQNAAIIGALTELKED